jgi:hypothetical protein
MRIINFTKFSEFARQVLALVLVLTAMMVSQIGMARAASQDFDCYEVGRHGERLIEGVMLNVKIDGLTLANQESTGNPTSHWNQTAANLAPLTARLQFAGLWQETEVRGKAKMTSIVEQISESQLGDTSAALKLNFKDDTNSKILYQFHFHAADLGVSANQSKAFLAITPEPEASHRGGFRLRCDLNVI